MRTEQKLSHNDLYRLPWNLADNAISWLEPTSACNLDCDGCYRENVAGSHKSLQHVSEELDVFDRLRKADGVSIAGGDPLLHPHIAEIVAEVARRGYKPVINTNGSALTRELLYELKRAGVYGFTFHIDSRQGRPKWKQKNETELNELRLYYAEMLAEAGNISCAFNSTVYEETLEHVPEMIRWAARHIDKVQVMVFIMYRQAVPNIPFDWYAGATKIDMNRLVYSDVVEKKIDLTSHDLVAAIRKEIPEFLPAAYLNGTERSDSFKWLLTGRVGTKEKIHGYVGPKFMEIMQTMHHIGTGKYLAYAKPKMTRKGRSMMLLSPFDAGIRGVAKRYLSSLLTNPLRVVHGLHYQSIMIIQPVDFLCNGAQNMCDGCPDITVWNGDLVWSCRMEELKHFGCWVRTVPRDGVASMTDDGKLKH